MDKPSDLETLLTVQRQADEIEADYGGDPDTLANGLERSIGSYDLGPEIGGLVAAELRKRAAERRRFGVRPRGRRVRSPLRSSGPGTPSAFRAQRAVSDRPASAARSGSATSPTGG